MSLVSFDSFDIFAPCRGWSLGHCADGRFRGRHPEELEAMDEDDDDDDDEDADDEAEDKEVRRGGYDGADVYMADGEGRPAPLAPSSTRLTNGER